MPLQFDINLYGKNALPPKYRLPRFLLFVKACLYTLAWRMGLFTQFRDDSSYAAYSNTTTYGLGQRVAYNHSIYESLTSGNSGNNPQADAAHWLLVNQYVAGASERVLYNGRYLNLTYQLNRYFQQELTAHGFTGFRQPPYPDPYGGGAAFSDIYIVNVGPAYESFMMSGSRLSYMYPTHSTDFLLDTPVFDGETYYQFNIYIPTAVYFSLGSEVNEIEAVVSAFVNKYVAAGTTYMIKHY